MNKDIKVTGELVVSTESFYKTRAEAMRKLDKKLGEKLTKISEAAKEASEYIQTRVD